MGLGWVSPLLGRLSSLLRSLPSELILKLSLVAGAGGGGSCLGEVLLAAMAEMRADVPGGTHTACTLVCVVSDTIPLSEARPLVESMVKGQDCKVIQQRHVCGGGDGSMQALSPTTLAHTSYLSTQRTYQGTCVWFMGSLCRDYNKNYKRIVCIL